MSAGPHTKDECDLGGCDICLTYLQLTVLMMEERRRRTVDLIDGIRSCLCDQTTWEYVAAGFHSHYERLAPEFRYATRVESAVPWCDVPEANRQLMITTVGHVLRDLLDRLDLGRNP